MRRTYSLSIGDKLIRDILNPKPEEIDLAVIEKNLRVIRRFTNAEGALTVHQHRLLVHRLVATHEDPEFPETCRDAVQYWSIHHDDHEGITWDITGPIKNLIGEHTDILRRVEDALDRAICFARNEAVPTEEVRRWVHYYDKLAETLEWRFAMVREPESWNLELSPELLSTGPTLIEWARSK